MPSPLLALDLLLRGGGCALLLLLAALLLRDDRRSLAARLGALFAVGGAAYDLCASPILHAQLGWIAIPILALASGNNLVMWLFARALFDDAAQLVIVRLGFAATPLGDIAAIERLVADTVAALAPETKSLSMK